MSKTIIISAFPACGKTHFFNENKETIKVLDSDSSTFDKSGFPQNYIQHIKSQIGKVDVLLVSSHEDVRAELENEGIKFILMFPFAFGKEEWLRRFKERGDNGSFINLVSENWHEWIENCNYQKGCMKIQLGEDEYLSDFF